MNRTREGAAARSPFGKQLRELRITAGLSQAELAERALVSIDSISALERGVSRTPQRETLAQLVAALDLSSEQRLQLEHSAERPSRPRLSPRWARRKTNLPPSLTKLFGRQTEIARIASLLDHAGVITLTGTGGVGKTQLALQTARTCLDRFSDGVWFVDLAPLLSATLVPSAVAAALAVSEPAGRPLTELIAGAIREKTMLLVIDNCEHVLSEAAALISHLRAAAPQVRVLATSRQSLGIAGEQVYRVESLEIADAAALFEERAKNANASLELSGEDRESVARVCRHLDGIPFAIELAAARLRVLGLERLEAGLAERFRLLSGGARSALPRYQTMQALIDWSYDLLGAEEKALFVRLGVFAAAFSLEAVVAVCSGDANDEWRVVELLDSLVDKSLVRVEARSAPRRYRLLETVRAYASLKLGDEWNRTKRRHAQYYAERMEAAEEDFAIAPSTVQWTAVLDGDLEDFRAALDWAFGDSGDFELGVRLLTAMRVYWIQKELTAEAARRSEAALQRNLPLPKELEAALWLTLSTASSELFVPAKTLDASARARQLYEELGDRLGTARSLRGEGIARLQLGQVAEAGRDLDRSLALTRESGPRREVARALVTSAVFLQVGGRLEEARRVLSGVVDLAQDGDERIRWVSSLNLAEVEFALGEVADAITHAYENLESDTLRRNARLRANQESNLTAYLLAAQRHDEARMMATAAIRDARDAGDRGPVAVALQHAAAGLSQQSVERAAELLGFVERALGPTGYQREYTERFTYELLMRTLRARLSEAEIATLVGQGASLTEEQAVQLASLRPADGRSKRKT
jgi:predicted ATPase/DNA-binding XRE family transcriptional regulator